MPRVALRLHPILLTFLAGTAALGLRADVKKRWVNHSPAPYIVSIVPKDDPARTKPEIANMWFTNLKSKGTTSLALGENSFKQGGTTQITLPPFSEWDVEFTHSWGKFYHRFRITDAKGGYRECSCEEGATTKAGYFQLSTLSSRSSVATQHSPIFNENRPDPGDLTLYRPVFDDEYLSTTYSNLSFVNKSDHPWVMETVPFAGFSSFGPSDPRFKELDRPTVIKAGETVTRVKDTLSRAVSFKYVDAAGVTHEMILGIAVNLMTYPENHTVQVLKTTNLPPLPDEDLKRFRYNWELFLR